MKSNTVLIMLLLVSLAANLALAVQMRKTPSVDYQAKYKDLRQRYVTLAKSEKELLEVVGKTPGLKNDVAVLFPGAYTNVNDEAFNEAVRRKIVRLELESKDLEKD